MPELTFNQIAILLVVAVAAVIDVKTTKIPNVITFPAAAVAMTSPSIRLA